MKLRWASLIALVLFLAACGEPPDDGSNNTTPKITLTADRTSVTANGGKVKLTVKVDSGTVTDFDFQENGVSKQKGKEPTATINVPANTGAAKQLKYKVVGTIEGGTVQSNEVTVNQAAGTVGSGLDYPQGAVVKNTVADVKATLAADPAAIVVVEQDLICNEPNQDAPTPQSPDGDPCIKLEEGQQLLAGNATTKKLSTTPSIKITTDIPVKFGNSQDLAKSRVVEMANNTVLQGFEFTGPDMYAAINIPDGVTGSVTIKHVLISSQANSIEGTPPTPRDRTPLLFDGTPALTIEDLALTSTTAINIDGFSSANIKGLKLTLNRPAGATGSSFSLTSAAATSSVVLDGLDLTTTVGGSAADGVVIQSGVLPTDAGAMTVTVTNSKVTFGEKTDEPSETVAFKFTTKGTSTIAIQTDASKGNSTNSLYRFAADYQTGVSGTIELAQQ